MQNFRVHEKKRGGGGGGGGGEKWSQTLTEMKTKDKKEEVLSLQLTCSEQFRWKEDKQMQITDTR